MRILIAIFTLFLASFSFGQGGVIHFTGNVKDLDGNKRLAGTNIRVTEGGSVVKNIVTSGGGSFDFTVPVGKVYKVEFTKGGYVGKFINIDARNIIVEDLPSGEAAMHFEITIFQEVEEVDFSFLKNTAVAEYAYDADYNTMSFDQKKMRNVKNQIQDKIEEMNALKAQEEMKVKNFNKLVAEGDKLFAKDKYEEALLKYQEAKNLIPDDPTILIKIEETQKKAEEQKQKDQLAKVEEQYQKAMQDGLSAYNGKDYELALSHYSTAAQLKPNEQGPTDKIIEIEGILEKLKADQEAKEKLEKEYQNLITAGDNLLSAQDYANAKSKYEEALKLKPGESHPQEKINQINTILSDLEANAAKEEQYKLLMTEAEGLLTAKDYENAKAKFQEASNIKPAESLPKSKIAEIDEILSNLQEEQQLEENYKKLVSEGDALFGQENYEGAKKKFEEALLVKAGEAYPKEKIEEINKKLDELKNQAAQQEQYDNFIGAADQLFESKKYQEAKDQYNLALGIKQNAAYPIAQIKKIDEELKKLNDAAELDKQYEQTLADAENLFNEKKYEEAKAKYQEALALKPAEKRPEAQIALIDKLIKELADKEVLENTYKKIVEDADGLLAAKDLNAAKAKYQEALQLRPGEAYPNQKITEIDQLLLDEAKNNKLEAQYQALVKEADALFDSENYNEAKSKYTDALGIKKDEKYPQQRLELIEQKMAQAEEARKREEQYKKLIKVGDDLFIAGTYTDAKTKYEEALKIKPDEAHPKQRLEEINKKLASQMEAAEKEEQYKKVIADADKLFTENKFNEAKGKYNEALSLKASEPYPTDKIQEIDNILKDMEADKAQLEKYNKIVADADKLFDEKNYNDAINKYKEALSVKQNEDYPQQQIDKITGIMKNQEEIELDKEYSKILKVADKSFDEKNYDKAIELYKRALTFKPQEEYPQSKLKEIQDLKDQEAANLAKQGEIDKQFKDLVAKGDQALGISNFDFAKEKYKAALALKPGEAYPQQKLDEIEQILISQANKEELDQNYKDLITNADAKFSSTNYDEAIKLYEQALKLKSNEAYPKSQIDLAKQRLSEIAPNDKDKQYISFIKTADEDFAARNWEEAMNSYMSALEIKPDEVHPNQRVEELRQILEKLALEREAQFANERNYKDAIKKADDFFRLSKYKEARTEYQRAVSIKNEAYPANQILICEQKINEAIAGGDNAQIKKILTVADKKMEAEDYNKALELYQRVISFKSGHPYATSKIAQINEILAKLNSDDVNLTDWGNEVNMDESNLQLLIANSQANAKWRADTTVSNQKHKQNMLDQYRTENQVDGNHEAQKGIKKIEADLKKAEEDADDERLKTTNEVVTFRTGINDKNTNDLIADENISHKENRKIDNFADSRIKKFEKSDDKRLNNEMNVVAYNVELGNYQREGDKLNYDGATKTRNQIGDYKLDVDDWKQEADLNRQGNAKHVDTYNNDLQLDRNDKQANQIALNYNQKNEINSVELEIENNFKNADDPRKNNNKKVVTYNNGLNERRKADDENQYNEIDKTNNDIKEYKVNTEKWKNDADVNRQNNEMEVVSYNNNLVNEKRKANDGFYDNITDTKNDIRDVETLIKENQKDDDQNRQNNELVVGTYKSDLSFKEGDDREKEKDRYEKTKIDINVLADTKNRKDQEGLDHSINGAKVVGNYQDDLAARKSKNGLNENDKIEETNNNIDEIKNATPADLSKKEANKLADKYPQGVTEEKFEKKNAQGVLIGYVTRRIVVQGDRGDVYEKIQTKFGTSYLKNGDPCTEYLYVNESAADKLTK